MEQLPGPRHTSQPARIDTKIINFVCGNRASFPYGAKSGKTAESEGRELLVQGATSTLLRASSSAVHAP